MSHMPWVFSDIRGLFLCTDSESSVNRKTAQNSKAEIVQYFKFLRKYFFQSDYHLKPKMHSEAF